MIKFVKCPTSNQFNLTMTAKSWFRLWKVIENNEEEMNREGVHIFFLHLRNLVQGQDDFAELIAERAEQDDEEPEQRIFDADLFANIPTMPPGWGEERD
jgi:hypothetical protein